LIVDEKFSKMKSSARKDTLDDERCEYLSYILLDRRLSEKTKESYDYELRNFHDYLRSISVTSSTLVSRENIQNYLKQSASLKSRSIAHRITTLREFYKFLLTVGKINVDVMSDVKGPRLEKVLPNTLTVEEVDKLLDISLDTVFDYRNRAILELLYASGLRISEALSLTFHDVSLNSCTIRVVGKGKKERIVPLGDVAILHLKNYLEHRHEIDKKHSDFLFLNVNGTPLSRVGFFKNLQKILLSQNIQKKVTPHTLRHSFATHMIEYGADLRVVQELLGHSDISTTRIYTHITNKKVEDDYKNYHPRIKEDTK